MMGAADDSAVNQLVAETSVDRVAHDEITCNVEKRDGTVDLQFLDGAVLDHLVVEAHSLHKTDVAR